VSTSFDKPSEVWSHAFWHQIGPLERCLLFTLLTFDSWADEDRLSEAYADRLKYEKEQHNQSFNTNQFNQSVKLLQDGFISVINLVNWETEYGEELYKGEGWNDTLNF
jgi:hypothetical protein